MTSTKLEKIVINVGVGRLSGKGGFSDKVLLEIMRDLASISGQKPSLRAAKKSIATFGLRAGTTVGLKTTLRGRRMMQFLDRLNNITLPRVRDFRGIDLKNVDQNGNLNIGLKEHVVFSEIGADTTNVNFGLQITVVPEELKSREEAIQLYRDLGVPLKKE